MSDQPRDRSAPPDAAARGGDDARRDDWQWDDIDWSEGTRRPSPEPTSVARDAEEARGLSPSGEQDPAHTGRGALIRRRRIAALVVLGLVFVLALVIPLAVFSGGDGETAVEQTTPLTTAARTTTAAQTTAEEPAVTTAPTTTPEATPLRVTLPDGESLSRGDRGSEVEDLQKGLAALGFSVGEPDGVFGAITEAAVIDFQQSNDLTPDGVVGNDTVRLLNAALADKGATR
jgi:hypothetical protein